MTDTRTTIPTYGTLVVVTCWCGCQHAIPSGLNDWINNSPSNAVHCPLGHKWVRQRDSDARKLEAATARNRHLEDQLLAAGEEAERVRVALVRDRHRFANGVCPCCNRSFEALRRHIATQHPDYDPAHLDEAMYGCTCGRSFDTPRGLRIHQGRVRGPGWALPTASRWSAHLTVTH